MDAAQRLQAALTDLAHSLVSEPQSTMAAAIAGDPHASLSEWALLSQIHVRYVSLG